MLKKFSARASVKNFVRRINRPATRRTLLFSLMVVAFTLAVPHTAHGQHRQGGQSVRDAIEGAVRTIYTDWRLPISALGIVIAIALYMWSDPRGRTWAIRIVVAVVMFTLAPYILSMLSDWAGGSGAFDFGH